MKEYIIAEIPPSSLTLRELCSIFDLRADEVVELVEYGVIEPTRGRYPSDWRFGDDSLGRLRRALRLQRDLRMDHAGVALALDLIDEVHYLRRRLRVLDPDW